MHVIDYKDSGDLIINSDFTPHINLENINDEYVYQIDYIYNLSSISSFIDDVEHVLNTRKVERYWRISRDKENWSNWFELSPNEPINCDFDISPRKTHFIQLKWLRTGSKEDGLISINSFKLLGEWQRKITDGSVVIQMSEVGQHFYLKPDDVYKVYRLDDFELITTGLSSTRTVNIEYRISQDSGRTWSIFEPLTTENISTLRFTPIRFFEIEYKITRTGTDVDGTINIYELNLLGEFQNVSKDYLKTNLMGLRESCGKNITGESNLELNSNCQLPENFNAPLTDAEKVNLFKPYELNKAVDFYNKVSNSTNEVFGHEVTYFITQPDSNAIDHTFHEYQLYNVICEENIKVSVVDNKFPDNQITFNQFDLTLFETFEIHITKENFKIAFGVDKRPSKEDFLFFCTLNRMFQVEHAQAFKDFNNSSVYYKVILKKYNKKASVKPIDSTLESRIRQLTNNSTIEEFMGIEIEEDKVKVANKDEQRTLSQDAIRHDFKVDIVRELIDNASLVINKYHYDLSTIDYGKEAIRYKKMDKQLTVSDNRAYMAWFRLNNYAENEVYNFITNYDDVNNDGYIINLTDGAFSFTLNSNTYTMPIDNLTDDVWYCYLINIDQRQRNISQFLYKRNVADNEQFRASRLHSSELKLVISKKQNLSIDKFEFNNNIDIVIKASDMALTNIRLFNDIIPEDKHNKVLNQNLIRDSHYLILADNCNKKIDTLPNMHPLN